MLLKLSHRLEGATQPFFWVHMKHFYDEVLSLGAHSFFDLFFTGPRNLSLYFIFVKFIYIHTLECRRPYKHFEKQAAKCVSIKSWTVPL
mgnify:CR=1 FL=1|jgi:hypothetical protein